MSHATGHSESASHHGGRPESGTDWKIALIIALAILLAASLYTKGFSKGAASEEKISAANASGFLDSYLAGKDGSRALAELQAVKNEVDLRIYKLQMENEPAIQLVVISDSNCQNCYTDRVIKVSQQLFPKLEVDGIIDYNSTGGKLIAKRYGITLLPAYIFSNSVEQAANFNQIQPDLIKVGSDYVISPQVTGASFPVYD